MYRSRFLPFYSIYRIVAKESIFAEDLREEALFALAGGFAERFCEGAKDLFLLAREILGSLDVGGDDKIALALRIVDVGNSLATKSEGRARLRSLGNGELILFSAEKGNFYFCTECRFCKADRNVDVKVVAVSCEDVMRLYAHLDHEIACHTAVSSCRALSAKDDPLHIIDTLRNRDLELLIDLYVALAVAVFTGGLNDLTRSATGRAGSLRLGVAEHRLLLYGNEAATLAGGAGLGRRALFCTRRATALTSLNSCEADLFTASEGGLLEADGHSCENIVAVLGHISRLTRSAATAEEGREQVGEIKSTVEAAKSATAAEA